MRHRNYSFLFIILAILVVLCDQTTKYQAVAHLTNIFERSQKVTFRERLVHFYQFKSTDSTSRRFFDLRKPTHVVIPGYWNHKYVENPGAAWGLFAHLDEKWRVPFFHLVSLVALALIFYLYRQHSREPWAVVALSLVLGGATGNYIDRLSRNYVIDFIDWHWRNQPNMHWPTFNVGDSAICVGVAMMAMMLIASGRKSKAKAKAQNPAAA